MYLKQLLRSRVENIPTLANLYRTLRDELIFHKKKAVLTPLGFWLSGCKSMEVGLFEPDESLIIMNHLDDTDVFVDIGANVGYYSCLARSRGKRVISVEPHPKNVRALFRNIQLNSWNDIEVWPIALSDSPGCMTLWGGGVGASLVEGWSGISKSWKQTVAVSTLDIILGNRFIGNRLFIKVDVEGAEFGLLQGAIATLQREPRPIWMIEITASLHHPGANPHFAESFRMFWDNGYRAYTGNGETKSVAKSDVERWNNNGGRDIECYNWLFVPEGRASSNTVVSTNPLSS